MFVDTSAFVAVILGETEKNRIIQLWNISKNIKTSPIVRLETSMVVAQKLGIRPSDAKRLFDKILYEANITVVAIDDNIGNSAVEAYEKFGKGGHPAKLNLADCLSYAVAKSLGIKILFVGNDFSKTDLKSAL